MAASMRSRPGVRRPRRAPETFRLSLEDLRPSQLYISREKLHALGLLPAPALFGPLPVIEIGDELVLTDGHTRALAHLLAGRTEVAARWDGDPLDLAAYGVCLAWCRAEGVDAIADLRSRIVDPEAYRSLWLDRCAEMHGQLERSRTWASTEDRR